MEIKRQKWIIEDERGKRPGQKFRSLLVMQYILKIRHYAGQNIEQSLSQPIS